MVILTRADFQKTTLQQIAGECEEIASETIMQEIQVKVTPLEPSNSNESQSEAGTSRDKIEPDNQVSLFRPHFRAVKTRIFIISSPARPSTKYAGSATPESAWATSWRPANAGAPSR